MSGSAHDISRRYHDPQFSPRYSLWGSFMNRRQFLQSLTAAGTNAILPTFALAYQGSSTETPKIAPPTIQFQNIFEEDAWDLPRIGILSVGGIGGTILSEQAKNFPYLSRTIAIDTNPFSLQGAIAEKKILVGDGANLPADINAAQFFANSARQEIANSVAGLDIVFIVAGMGGSTGTGVSPVVADVLRNQDILTLGATIMPFDFEGQRLQIAHAGIRALSQRSNAVLPIFNETFAHVAGQDALIGSVMKQASITFTQLYRSILNTVAVTGIIGVDFADVRCLLQGEGHSAFGFGSASGINGAESATRQAIAHPLLAQCQLQMASGILVAIEGSSQALKMKRIGNIVDLIKKEASSTDHFICSAVVNPELDEDFRVSILAHGFC